MTVSVLIPYYNDRDFLGQAIESVLNQTYEDFELILINHATTDDCREIAHSYSDKRIKHIDMDKNYGAGGGLIFEKFLDNATGEYIKTLCADDILYPNCLEDLVNYMINHPQKDFAFGDVEFINSKNESLKKSYFKTRFGFSTNNTESDCIKQYFNSRSFLPYIGCIAKRRIFDDISIDKSLIMTFDMSLWLSLLLKGYKIGYLDKYIAGYRIHDGQMCNVVNQKRIKVCSGFENLRFIELFLENKNIPLLKNVFSNNKYIKSKADISDFDMEFIISYELLKQPSTSARMVGYMHISQMLNNNEQNEYLQNNFNFGVAEFRKMYSYLEINPFEDIKQCHSKLLWYLLFKRILKKVSLSDLWKEKGIDIM